MNFSAILDISSFFIGMIINLLLIALICYYFKKKYEHLEIAQNEQAKVLYKLLQNSHQPKVINVQDILESDSDSDSDSEDEMKVNETFDKIQKVEKVEKVEKVDKDTFSKVEDLEKVEDLDEKDYSKMNMKQLKDILTSKGINPGKMKKNEIIELIESSDKDNSNSDSDKIIDLSIELSSTTIDAE
jgi:hypothetical protein